MERLPKALIVEDDEDSRELLAALLRMNGWETVLASTALEALELTRQHPFEIAFIDFVLPDGDGASLPEQLQRLRPSRHPRFVAISGEQRARSPGFDDFLPKPISREKLLAILSEEAARHG